MLDRLEALVAVSAAGTVSAAALRLRLTQSAVTKRIRALERTLGYAVLEPDGRRVRLTVRGAELVERAGRLVAELRALGEPVPTTGKTELTLAMADSIASSWGPAVLRSALDGEPDLRLALHAHRSVLVVESVRLGRYHLGLCAETGAARDLVRELVVEEPMVVAHAGLAASSVKGAPLITIEPSSATWRSVASALRREAPELLRRVIVPVESFAAALQMVRAGFGDGLVPLGVVLSSGCDRRGYRRLPGVTRRVSLHSRKTVGAMAAVALLREKLALLAREYLEQK